MAEYAKAKGLEKEPPFIWWVGNVLRRRDIILKATKSNRYWMRTHKYGVELPHLIKWALAIDKKPRTTYWQQAIEKEMKNNRNAFEFDENDTVCDKSYTKITTHMAFGVKLGTLTRKARLCADGHKVPTLPKESTYSSVPSRDSVRIFFLLAALNGIDILSADIQNVYLTAPLTEK